MKTKKSGAAVSMAGAIEITCAFEPQKADRAKRFPHTMPDGTYKVGQIIRQPTPDEESLVAAGWAKPVRSGGKK